jgi:hypothetical protein
MNYMKIKAVRVCFYKEKALTGQARIQILQSLQAALTMALSSPARNAIAHTGQILIHPPQLVHSAISTFTIFFPPFLG